MRFFDNIDESTILGHFRKCVSRELTYAISYGHHKWSITIKMSKQ